MSNANLIILLSTLSTGLILGAIFALVAAGVTIVYGSIWMPNAANGQFFVLAALFGWTMTVGWGLSPWIAALLVIGVSVPLSYILEVLLIRRFYDVPNRNISYFVLSLGITQILAGIYAITYGRWSDQFQLPPLVTGITLIGPFPIANNRLMVLAIAIALLAALFILLRYHRYGRALRAVFQNRDAATLRGVNVKAIYSLSFILGNAVIFAGGVLFALAYSFDLTVAWTMAITAFAIMIIGGPGSVLGALVVGMVFGFTQAIVSIFASPTIAAFSYLGAMLLILLFKPSGVFAR
ncbi:MAG: branched-chain amino acid ABC transporter permease [Chelatococcus sp.]|jgi:branched-subunit amino acid ABC-type transport system permease component|uniref:branched-chain amino acid ABC transporter permease n=1 Tax=unclassified Chelatococcus TaxID=2638111 RepID=UPI001BCCC550|nr:MULTISPECIES: branched-chain amino acid ABC transporter permease [unclassified Chelatococcus]CAH1651339.1 Branched-chain amino acid transport system permease protein [Hyphomicrobiales bacterium]MBS7743185.1 branched-chain amino acid ABC transporter permease [Chelatococcus sp. HY11]MBX3540997.1 branched-chain amino acid ABC transporter permease [Chelatococcus sp.]MBX3541697.1 branched-chain amino acid ABC transporter permease [Chelatococcus sp.]MCO5074411.1 branched-chain amino acid ABC tran